MIITNMESTGVMNGETDKKELLKRTLSRVLRPLVRLTMVHGLGYREFCDLARVTYFEVGRSVLEEQKQKINDSRLSLLTGLNRKEISYLDDLRREKGGTISDAPKPRSPGAAVIAAWVSDPRFLDAEENPKALQYASDDNSVETFTKLVEHVSKDMRPKAYLTELQRLDLVEVSEDMVVRLKRDAFVPTADFSEKLSFFTGNVHDHMAAAMANIEGRQPPFFERSAYHGKLSADDALALQKLINSKGMSFLKKMYHEAEELSKTKPSEQAKDQRMTLGVYFYSEAESRDEK